MSEPNIQEEDAPKEEKSAKLPTITIFDITEDTPMKTQVLTEEEIQAKVEKDTSFSSNNIVLLKVMDYPQIEDTSTINTIISSPQVVIVDMLAGISTSEAQDQSKIALQSTSIEETQKEEVDKSTLVIVNPHVEDKGKEEKEIEKLISVQESKEQEAIKDLVQMSSGTTPKKAQKKKVKTSTPKVTLEEDIMIPKWDIDNLSYEQMQILQDLLKKKRR